jgi:choline dehydrogenase-like flavoprotein
MERDYDYASFRHFADLPDPRKIGETAGKRAAARLGAEKIASGAMTVFYDQRKASSLLSALLGAINGNAITRGVSYLKDKMGEAVFNDSINIIDDPLMIRGLATRPCDGEGAAVQRAHLIKNGVLQQWLLNTSAAKQLGLTTTGHASRSVSHPPGIGASMKDRVRTPGVWDLWIGSFGETLPRYENHVSLHATKIDKWGFPIPIMNCEWTDNEVNAVRQAAEDAHDMMEACGATVYDSNKGKVTKESLGPAGNGIHEMGTLRMGKDPSTSVLNKWNQSHDIPNLFCSDGAFMTSSACQNPSLTYMAFSARAANHAADLMKAGEI